MLVVEREGKPYTIRTFDNTHGPEEHHEHPYIRDQKGAPIVTHGPVNEAMHSAESRVYREWRDIVAVWERTWTTR